MDTSAARRARFEEIYSKHEWGGGSKSGPGSDPHSTGPFVRFIEEWLARHPDVVKVVEVGCGDWATSSLINWRGVNYLGVDIVEDLIAQNQTKFGAENISFVCADFIEDEIPHANVLIAKDVLQHLSNDAVRTFIEKHSKNFEYFIFCNDFDKTIATWKWVLWYTRRLQEPNADILDGSSRPLRLRDAPFNLVAEESLFFDTYVAGGPQNGKFDKTKPVLKYVKELMAVRNGK